MGFVITKLNSEKDKAKYSELYSLLDPNNRKNKLYLSEIMIQSGSGGKDKLVLNYTLWKDQAEVFDTLAEAENALVTIGKYVSSGINLKIEEKL